MYILQKYHTNIDAIKIEGAIVSVYIMLKWLSSLYLL